MISNCEHSGPEYINSIISVLSFLREWDRPQDIAIDFKIPAEINESFSRYLAWIRKNEHKKSLWPFDEEGSSIYNEILKVLADGYISRILESSRDIISAIFDVSAEQSIESVNAIVRIIDPKIEAGFMRNNWDLPTRLRRTLLRHADKHIRTLSTRIFQIQLSAVTARLERKQDRFLVLIVQIPDRFVGYSDEDYWNFVMKSLWGFSENTDVKLGIADLGDRRRAGGLLAAAEKRAKKDFGNFRTLLISGAEGFALSSPERGKFYSPLTNELAELIDHLKDNYRSLVLVLRGDKGKHLFRQVGPLGSELQGERFDVEFVEIEQPGESNAFRGCSSDLY